MLQNIFFGKRGQSLVSLLMFVMGIMANAQCSLTGWKKFSQTEQSSIAVKEDGTIWMWGNNTNGIKGDGTENTEDRIL